MKKFSFILFVLLIISSNSFAAEPPASTTGKVTTVGVIVPLTGPLAEFGVAMQNAVKLAQRNLKDELQHFTFIFEDSAYKPQMALSAFRKLASQDKVDFVINMGCPTSAAIAPVAEQLKIPTAMFCSANLLTKGKKYAFGMTSPAMDWAGMLASYLSAKKFTKLCILLTENDYLISEYNSLDAQVKASRGGQSLKIIERFLPSEADFRTTIAKFSTKECDALGVYLLPGQVRAFFTQFQDHAKALPIFGTDIFENAEEIKASGGGMENAVFVNIDVPSRFSEQYRLSYGNENEVSTACSTHAFLEAVVAAMKQSSSPDNWYSKLASTSKLSTACGEVSAVKSESDEQFLDLPLALKIVKDGKVEVLGRQQPKK